MTRTMVTLLALWMAASAARAEEAGVSACPQTEPCPCLPEYEAKLQAYEARETLFGRPIKRRVRFDLVFGVGGGNHTAGIYHSMTFGGTFKNEWSLSLMHLFTQNDGVFGPNSGPDLVGSWLPVVHVPLKPRELSLYFGFGPGGYHEQEGGITAIVGYFYTVGLDLIYPVHRRTGPILRVAVMQAFVPRSDRDQLTTFTANIGLGWAVF